MSGTVAPGTLRGFSGKVPARGDFVHAGLPRDFTDPWHDWQSAGHCRQPGADGRRLVGGISGGARSGGSSCRLDCAAHVPPSD